LEKRLQEKKRKKQQKLTRRKVELESCGSDLYEKNLRGRAGMAVRAGEVKILGG